MIESTDIASLLLDKFADDKLDLSFIRNLYWDFNKDFTVSFWT